MSDVYADLAGMIPPENGGLPAGGWMLGTVLQEGTGPALRVACNGMTLTGEDLWLPDYLKEGWSPGLAGTLSGTCTEGGACTVPVEPEQLRRKEGGLKTGDQVVVAVSRDGQDYYIVCKAVRP